jgi:hypothetical protein
MPEKPLTDDDRAKLRLEARTWLEAELAAWSKLIASGSVADRRSIANTLKHWQQDADLASVRDATAVAKLPADERDGWRSLWRNVDASIAKASAP